MQQDQSQIARVILSKKSQSFPQDLLKIMETNNQFSETIISQKYANLLRQKGDQVEEWHALYLIIIYSQKVGVLKTIKEINFPCLKTLKLLNNKIECLEAISRLNAPKLQQVSIKDNKINNISPFKKMLSTQIQTLDFCKNPIIVANSLTEGNWENIITIAIEDYSQSKCQNLTFCVKMEHRNNKAKYHLDIISKDRIQERNLLLSLEQKYLRKSVKIWMKYGQFTQ